MDKIYEIVEGREKAYEQFSQLKSTFYQSLKMVNDPNYDAIESEDEDDFTL